MVNSSDDWSRNFRSNFVFLIMTFWGHHGYGMLVWREENRPQRGDIGDCTDEAIPHMKDVNHMDIEVSQH